jgi:hypothetical protein
MRLDNHRQLCEDAVLAEDRLPLLCYECLGWYVAAANPLILSVCYLDFMKQQFIRWIKIYQSQ